MISSTPPYDLPKMNPHQLVTGKEIVPLINANQPEIDHQQSQNPSQKIDNDHINFQYSNLEQAKQTKIHWGNINPFFISKETGLPLITVTSTFYIHYLANILGIILICFGVPILINLDVLNRTVCNSAPNSENTSKMLINMQPPINQQSVESSCKSSKSLFIFLYSLVWAVYQFVFLTILILSNPGYSQQRQSNAIDSKQVNSKPNEDNQNLANLCKTCGCQVDNFVFHCDDCNLCCQEFSHHCNWIGKCIGSRNKIILKSYTFGYSVGLVIILNIAFWINI